MLLLPLCCVVALWTSPCAMSCQMQYDLQMTWTRLTSCGQCSNFISRRTRACTICFSTGLAIFIITVLSSAGGFLISWFFISRSDVQRLPNRQVFILTCWDQRALKSNIECLLSRWSSIINRGDLGALTTFLCFSSDACGIVICTRRELAFQSVGWNRLSPHRRNGPSIWPARLHLCKTPLRLKTQKRDILLRVGGVCEACISGDTVCDATA